MVVIKIHNRDNYNDVIPLVLEDNMCFCTHKLNGADTLEFEIQRQNSNYIYIQEEVKVECFDNRFIIKQIDEHSDFVTVMCDLDFDEWRSDVFVKYRRTNVNIITVMEEIVPQGWHITYGQGVDLTKRTTVEQSQGEAFRAATSYDILDAVRKAFVVEFSFDVIGKVIGVINVNSYTSSGEYFMEELNMTDLGFNGDSTEFATRVYAYGKRDEDTDEYITFADINDGKEYVEDKTYVDKVVSYVLIDERYTVKEHLLEYARTVLSEKCKPVRSYECSVINFNNDMYLYKIVTIIDKTRKLRIEHQCVEYVEYKDNRLDKVTLSTLTPSFERIVKSVDSQIQEQISSATSGIQDLINASIDRATDAIVGNNGGYFRWIFDSDGRPIELVNLYDSMDLDTAQKVWRWNAGGLGHSNNGYNGNYSLALTKDGEINASMITTGILNADVIKAGTISDVAGNNYWDLVNGEFSITNGTINVTTSGAETSAIELNYGSKRSWLTPSYLGLSDATSDIELWPMKIWMSKNDQLYFNVSGAGFYYTSEDGTLDIISNQDQLVIGKNKFRIYSDGTNNIHLDYSLGNSYIAALTLNANGTIDLDSPLPVSEGGTGATSLDAAGILTKDGTQYASGAKVLGTGSGVYRESGNPQFSFRRSASVETTETLAQLFPAVQTVNSKNVMQRFYIRQMSYNESGDQSTYYENYRLPVITADRSSNVDYEILTSKNVVTVVQGGTGATTAADARVNLGVPQAQQDGRNVYLYEPSGSGSVLAIRIIPRASNNIFLNKDMRLYVTNSDLYLRNTTDSTNIWVINKDVVKNSAVTFSGTATFAANETKNVTLTATLPSGYAWSNCTGISGYNTGNGNLVFITINTPTSGSLGVTMRNFSSSSVTATFTITYHLTAKA